MLPFFYSLSIFSFIFSSSLIAQLFTNRPLSLSLSLSFSVSAHFRNKRYFACWCISFLIHLCYFYVFSVLSVTTTTTTSQSKLPCTVKLPCKCVISERRIYRHLLLIQWSGGSGGSSFSVSAFARTRQDLLGWDYHTHQQSIEQVNVRLWKWKWDQASKQVTSTQTGTDKLISFFLSVSSKQNPKNGKRTGKPEQSIVADSC